MHADDGEEGGLVNAVQPTLSAQPLHTAGLRQRITIPVTVRPTLCRDSQLEIISASAPLPFLSSFSVSDRRVQPRHANHVAALSAALRPHRYPDAAFDAITALITRTLGVPVALLSLVEASRQCFPGATGLPQEYDTCGDSHLEMSLCRYVVDAAAPYVVEDIRTHPELRAQRGVRDLGVVAYAGVPLKTADGIVLGALAAIDTAPRWWSEKDLEWLRLFAVPVVSELELRATLGRREIVLPAPDAKAAGMQTRATEILESISDGMLALDQDWRFTYLNARASEHLGRLPDTLLGVDIRAVTPPLVTDEVMDAWKLAIASGEPIAFTWHRVETGQWFEGRAFPASLGLSVYLRDVTDGRQAANALREREMQLQQAQKMEAVGLLAGGVAHDFNNMLTVITANCEMLRQTAMGVSGLAEVEEIHRAATRAAELTHQLLAFSRQQVLQPRAVDMNQIVGAIVPMLRRLLPANIQVLTALSSAPATVLADPGQLEQVLMNLAVNARDAMPNGGALRLVTAREQLDSTRIARPSPIAPGDWIRLAVTDSGTGIEEELQDRVFEPFFTTKPLGEGTGLGLSTVHGIVEQSGGSVTLDSFPGEGTTVSVWLPYHDGPVAHEPEESVRSPDRGNETVLVIEDEPAVRRIVERVLGARGYRIVVAANAEEALRIAQPASARFDLVVSDVVMPGIGGPALVERLRERHPGVRVLFMSGYTDFEDAPTVPELSEVAFLQKPFTAQMLAHAVRSVLDGVTGTVPAPRDG